MIELYILTPEATQAHEKTFDTDSYVQVQLLSMLQNSNRLTMHYLTLWRPLGVQVPFVNVYIYSGVNQKFRWSFPNKCMHYFR